MASKKYKYWQIKCEIISVIILQTEQTIQENSLLNWNSSIDVANQPFQTKINKCINE